MIPSLFEDGLTSAPDSGAIGIGKLTDVMSLEIYREINGQYELEMDYPMTGALYSEIQHRRFFWVSPAQDEDPQLFRIYRITKPLKGVVTVNARHVAYDLEGYIREPFDATTIALAMANITQNTIPECPFEFSTDKTTAANFSLKAPLGIWSVMAGQQGSLLDVFGGEYDFDNFSVALNARLGNDNGVTIRYGKNLMSLEQEENIANCYTAVYPYYLDQDGNLVTLTEKTIPVDGTFDYEKVLSLDLTMEFLAPPEEDQLRAATEKYIAENNIGEPAVSLSVDFVALWQTEDYKTSDMANLRALEKVSLGDTVHVQFPQLGVDASARVVAYRYDCLKERYSELKIGKVKQNLASDFVAQAKEVETKVTVTVAEQIAGALAGAMLGSHGGAVRLVDTNGDGSPDELYIADNPDLASAVKVWRFNYLGWAASDSGYAGPYTMGATLMDGILAEAVTAAHLTAGTIQSADGQTVVMDLDNGIVQLNAAGGGFFKINGYDIDDYFHIGTEGGQIVVRIGSSQNGIVLKQRSDRISFCDTEGNELAYWNNNSFRLVELQSFQLGDMELVSQPNGSVSFVKASS